MSHISYNDAWGLMSSASDVMPWERPEPHDTPRGDDKVAAWLFLRSRLDSTQREWLRLSSEGFSVRQIAALMAPTDDPNEEAAYVRRWKSRVHAFLQEARSMLQQVVETHEADPMFSWEDAAVAILEEVAPAPNVDPFEAFDKNPTDFLAIASWALAKLGVEYENHSVEYLRSLLAAVLVAKQFDYGHDNIRRFGRMGVKVRLWDKLARYRNLTARQAVAKNESLVDTFIDIIGYCVIAVMLETEFRDGTLFDLQLSVDMFGGDDE